MKNSDRTARGSGWLRDVVARNLLLAVLALVSVGALLPALAVAEAPCGNESLRAAFGQLLLPDCRTYEMVSPIYKEGYPIFVAEHSFSSGKAILTSLGSLDTLGNSESAQKGALYLATRTPSGWKVSAINAASSEFVGEYPAAAEPNSGETLWEQHTPQESITKLGLYARSTGASPSFRFIGPLNIPFQGEPSGPSTATNLTSEHLTLPVAATNDYGHVIVEGLKDHWSFDATPFAHPSLYEYSGTDNVEPVIVGVSGKSKGSTELVGHCGTLLGGGPSGSMYNALSSDGKAVFFTVLSQCGASAPESNEVYARVNGALTDPGPAKTVDVSASVCTVSGSECTDKSGKNFEGASESGQRVFFTSTQKLTDDAVDGTASGDATEVGCSSTEAESGPGCNLYEYRFNLTDEPSPPHLAVGTLRLVAGGEVLGVTGIAKDGSRLYFVSRNAMPSAGSSEFGKAPEDGQANLYVYDTVMEKATFIATLQASDKLDWRRGFLARTTEVGGEHGQYLLFESAAHLTPDDTSGLEQLFEYDAESDELVRVTKGENGYNQDGNGVRVGVPPNLMRGTAQHLGGQNDFKSTANRLNMSSDGHTVVFETGGRLSARATAAEAQAPEGPCRSLYEFYSAGPLSGGTVRLISDGRETQVINGLTCGPEFQAMGASGGDIMFESVNQLSPSDVDGGQRDIYDARVGGGFAVSGVEEQEHCGSACEAVSVATPNLGMPVSTSGSVEASLTTTAPKRNKVSSRQLQKTKKKSIKRRRKRKAHRSSMRVAFRVGR